jgi:hypothetical protein
MLPVRSCMPRSAVPLSVAMWMVSSGLNPILTAYFDNNDSLRSRYSTTYFSTFDGRGAEP